MKVCRAINFLPALGALPCSRGNSALRLNYSRWKAVAFNLKAKANNTANILVLSYYIAISFTVADRSAFRKPCLVAYQDKLRNAPSCAKLVSYNTTIRPALEYGSVIWEPYSDDSIMIERI